MGNNSNSKGFAALDDMRKRLLQLHTVPERSAPQVAKAAKAEMIKQVRKQQGPDGRAWPKSKTGERVLVRAGNVVRVSAVGSVVVMTLEDHYARHHLGAVKGKTKRPILPTERIPDPMVKAITSVVTQEFFAVMGGK